MKYFSKKIIKNLKEAMENDADFKNSLTEDKEICVLCGKHIVGYGNNPFPLANKGKCCDRCNSTKVIPARMKTLRGKKKIDEDVEEENIEDENIAYMVVFGDDQYNFDEVRDFSEVFNTEEEAIEYVKKELPLSEYRFAIVDEEEPSGSGRTFTVNPDGEVEEITGNLDKYDYEDYDNDYDDDGYSLDRYEVIEIDIDDVKKYYNDLEEYCEATEDYDVLDSFKDKDKAISYVDYLESVDTPACVYDTTEKKVIYRNKIEECLHKHCHKEFRFDDDFYGTPFRNAKVEVKNKELEEYDDEPNMDY